MRALCLIEAIAKSGNGLTSAELGAIVDMPRSSLFNLLHALVRHGYLRRVTNRYRLGHNIFRLATNIVSAWNSSSGIHPYLEEIALCSQEAVYLCVLDRDRMAIKYVDCIDSRHEVRCCVRIGAVRPLYCTAAGRVLLAFADEAFQQEYLRTIELGAHTARTISTLEALRAELTRVRKARISVTVGEMFPEAAAVSVPIFGSAGKIVATRNGQIVKVRSSVRL